VNSAADSPQLAPLAGAELVIVTIAIALAMFMEVLDMTIVNVSVPAIAGTLGVSPNEGTWTITTYSLAAAIMQPLTGFLGRRFGEVRTFVVSTLLFVTCSMVCGLATSMPMLVMCRLLQGAVSGPMAPMAQALLMRCYRPEKRGMALGLWGMVVFMAPIFGPILGGWITDNLSWPWLFYINIPVGLLAATATWSILRRRETVRSKVRIDVTGMLLLFTGVGALQYMLDNGNEQDWFGSPLIVTVAVIAVICLTLLVAWELTSRTPLIDLHLFAIRNFSVGLGAICFGFMSFMGANILFPLFLQTAAGYTATWAGLAMAPVGMVALLLMPLVGATLHRMNMRLVSTVGLSTLALCMYWYGTLNATASFYQLAGPRLLQGVGLAFFFMPLQQIMFSRIDPAHMASAAGLSSFLRNTAGSMGTAVSIWLWSARTDFHHVMLAQHLTAGANWNYWSGQLGALSGGNGGDGGAAALRYTEGIVQQQALTLATSDLFQVYALLLIVCVVLIWLARPVKRVAGPGSAH
jgi:MFS transporter, DHA2 family, multidrug resistance protein